MARKSTHIDAPPEAAWAVLVDGWSYADWVVGSRKVRAVDPGWPSPGTKIHHQVGVGPISWNDDTKVVEVDEPRRLLLEARLRPFGTARVQIELESDDGGTRATIDERPARGPMARLWTSVTDLLLRGRNVEAMRRFRRLAEIRTGDSPRRNAAGHESSITGANH